MQLLNRLAILLQFSAMSLLFLMWSRALKVSYAIDKKALKRAEILSALAFKRSRKNDASSNVDEGGSIDGDEAMKSHMMRETIGDLVHRTNAELNRASSFRGDSVPSSTMLSARASASAAGLTRQQVVDSRANLATKRYIWLGINIVAYLVILGTVVGDNDSTLWAVNLTITSFLCMVVAVGILYIGIKNWMRLRRELSPVYTTQGSAPQQNVNSSGSAAQTMSVNFFQHFGRTSSVSSVNTRSSAGSSGSRPSLTARGAPVRASSSGGSNSTHTGSCSNLCRSIEDSCASCYYNYLVEFWILLTGRNDAGDERLQIQTEVLRTVLVVSLTVAFFFTLRCYAFLYNPMIEDRFHAPPQPIVAETFYPWMYYQLPELFPNLFIALGISPPKGIMRQWKLRVAQWIRCVFGWTCCICIYICCSRRDPQVQAGADDEQRSSDDLSPTACVDSSPPPAIRSSLDSDRSDMRSECNSTDTDANNRATQGFDFDPYRSRREEQSPRGSDDVENPMWKPAPLRSEKSSEVTTIQNGRPVKKSMMFDFLKSILPGSDHADGELVWPTRRTQSIVAGADGAIDDGGDAHLENYVYAISGFNPAYNIDKDGSAPVRENTNENEDWTENLDMFY